ncbi:MAG: hypothetical protein NUV70_08680 [Caldiserica bacterium]|jgi:type I restriction enzyme S subunit|nr:hypothetical protein [Caldisericota bacterium]
MAVWSIVKVSELYTGRRLGAEFYHLDKLRALGLLRSRSLHYVQDSFAHVRRILNTSTAEPGFAVPTFVFDLSDIEAHFLGEGLRVSGPAEIGSAKKIFKSGDVVISRLRPYLHEIAFADHDGMLLGSTEFIVLRQKKGSDIPAEFLFVFLMTKEVQNVLLWSQEGTNHPRFPESVLLEIPLPKPDESTMTQVIELVRKANQAFRNSRESYLQAERMVLEEIGRDKLDLSQPKWWTVSLSRAQAGHRIDAEHFQPKYDKLIAHLKKKGKVKRIHDLLSEPIQKGVTPEYNLDGSIVVVNSQHLGRYCLNFEATDRTTETFWKTNRRAQICPNDVMIYATGAYIGRANAYLETARALAGVDILLVRPTGECNPLYLAVFLNAPPGLMQSRMFASGSGQAHIYPEDVSCYWVFLPSGNFQQRIADLVRQSYQARQKAKVLLEEAKAKVEALIEGRGINLC